MGDRKQLRSNTLVIFLSDNGAHAPSDNQGGPYPGEYERLQVGNDNRPLRGHKSGVYEGGIRTPGVAHWRGRLQPAEAHTPLHAVDWMPTLCKLAGADVPGDLKWDGMDIWPVLTQPSQAWPARTLYSAAPGFRAQMVRHGDWKLVVQNPAADLKARKKAAPSEELYNLARDPGSSSSRTSRTNRMTRDRWSGFWCAPTSMTLRASSRRLRRICATGHVKT